MEVLLETQGLKKYFKTRNGNLHAVDDINLEIIKGETLGIVGESGCGKSTLGRTLVQLQSATEGRILFNGEDITNLKSKDIKKLRANLQIVFQDPFSSLDPKMVIFDIIAEPLVEIEGIRDKKIIEKRVFELMNIVGLTQGCVNAYPHELDGGSRQRVGIARALSINPDLIVCDEPVSALDVSIQAQILNLLMDLQESQNLTYVFITHDLSVVRHISNRIAVMYLGQIIEIAESAELFKNPKHPYTMALLKSIPRAEYVEGRQENKLEVISGELTSPINPEAGCRFMPRCPYASDKCSAGNISLTKINEGHKVACVLYDGGIINPKINAV